MCRLHLRQLFFLRKAKGKSIIVLFISPPGWYEMDAPDDSSHQLPTDSASNTAQAHHVNSRSLVQRHKTEQPCAKYEQNIVMAVATEAAVSSMRPDLGPKPRYGLASGCLASFLLILGLALHTGQPAKIIWITMKKLCCHL